jgi:hypothetical protein
MCVIPLQVFSNVGWVFDLKNNHQVNVFGKIKIKEPSSLDIKKIKFKESLIMAISKNH